MRIAYIYTNEIEGHKKPQENTMKTIAEMTTEELTALAAEINAEIARRSALKTKIRVTVDFSSYNARRYSRPWIAVITSWPVGGKAEMTFGSYLGSDRGGTCEIMAYPDDIIRYGQRDGRGNGGTSEWAVVKDGGTLEVITQAEARMKYNK
jgi:hypothetical protein